MISLNNGEEEPGNSVISEAKGSNASVPPPSEPSRARPNLTSARFDQTNIEPSADSAMSIQDFVRARSKIGWGLDYHPPTRAHDYKGFRRICDDLVEEVQRLSQFVDGETIADEACGVEAEILSLLEGLFDCPWGEGESLKTVVTIILAQVNNVNCTARHYRFLARVILVLRTRYVIDDGVTDAIFAIISETGLEQFRGSVMDTSSKIRYKLVREEP